MGCILKYQDMSRNDHTCITLILNEHKIASSCSVGKLYYCTLINVTDKRGHIRKPCECISVQRV